MRTRALSTPCPACGAGELRPVHREAGVPVHSCLLFDTAQAAQALATGRIELGLCGRCGFVSNMAFDPAAMRYGERYEETQGYSATFRAFHERLATALEGWAGVAGRRVLEIGCGKGEFLALLAQRGAAALHGFDPAYRAGRLAIPAGADFRVETRLFPPPEGPVAADLVVCKMTLEHIPAPLEFLKAVRAAVRWGRGGKLLLMVPDAERIWASAAFEDVYHEHCSYFTRAALAASLACAGFAVEHLAREYGEQYLIALASPSRGAKPAPVQADQAVLEDAASFSRRRAAAIEEWRAQLAAAGAGRTALWGSGSKAVAFLSACRPGGAVLGAVDINPHRHGARIPPQGHRILAGSELAGSGVGRVVAMNAIHRREIRASLDALGLDGVRLDALRA